MREPALTRTVRPAPGAALALALVAGAAPALWAQRPVQLSATLDASAAAVRYDGFLTSGALSMTPALQLDAPLGTLTARGTYLVFQSGNYSLQGLVAGSAFTPALGLVRGEVGGTLGTSVYQRTDEPRARFGHALARARVHVMGERQGLYVGGSLGRSALGTRAQPVAAYGGGAWRRFGALAVELSGTATVVGDTSYSDAEGALHWVRGRFEFDASAGARVLSSGGGDGVYGEAIGTWWLSPQVALVASGGRYPTDPSRGSIAGRYGALAVRIARRLAPSTVAGLTYLRPYRLRTPRASPGMAAPTGVEVLRGVRGVRVLRIRVPGAQQVELMGDFTDWREVPLTAAGDGLWELAVPLAPGSYRFNVRADGGAWVVPPGVTALADDFGGIVAVVVVK